jgi:SAM-dependent methyltransferase
MANSGMRDHWESVYRAQQSHAVSWYAAHLGTSLELLRKAGLNAHSRVIDVGAGASTLVDDLLDFGVRSIVAVDLSEAALAVARERLGKRGDQVRWIVEDVTRLTLPPQSLDIWHDRATLQFLVDPETARRYVNVATEALAPGGYAIIGGFAADGPKKCSGLPVARRNPEEIAALLGPRFELLEGRYETHMTPWGSPQRFAFALLRKNRE